MPRSELPVQAVYSDQGLRGLRDAGRGRVLRAAVTRAVESMGADEHPRVAMHTHSEIRFPAIRGIVESLVNQECNTMEAFRSTFGERDLFPIVDVPDAVRAASPSLNVNGAGVGGTNTSARITPEELDRRVAQRVAFRPPRRS